MLDFFDADKTELWILSEVWKINFSASDKLWFRISSIRDKIPYWLSLLDELQHFCFKCVKEFEMGVREMSLFFWRRKKRDKHF